MFADVLGDAFGSRVELAAEGFEGVEVFVLPGGEDFVQETLDDVEVDDGFDGVEFRRGEFDGHVEIVSVRIFDVSARQP